MSPSSAAVGSSVRMAFLRLALLQAVLAFVLSGAAPAPAATSPEYLIDTWQVDDGLPQSTVSCMAQTTDGYLWLGTFNGLVRFDGLRFTVFDPNGA